MRIAFALLMIAHMAQAQTSAQYKALNNYADFANQSADEVASVVMSIIQYYPTINQKSALGAPRYSCPVQLEDYYLKIALAEGKNLPPALSTSLNTKLNELAGAAEKIDEKCKALDTYHKLGDYKQDNFARAAMLISELQLLVRTYRTAQDVLRAELEAAHKKINPNAEQTAYGKADATLRSQIARERLYLDTWTFNLNESLPTGWPVDKLEQSIADTDEQLAALKKQNPPLKYPTSSMWSTFQQSLATVLDAKRHALDGYNNEAKKSDRHANDVYLGLINYFNGTLVADQNGFIQYASQDGYRGLKAIKYFPLFEVRTQATTQRVDIKPFQDYPHTPLAPAGQKIALSKTAYSGLVNYVKFINETWRQTDRLARLLGNLSSSAAYYKTLDSYERHGGMSFDYKDFKLPLSQYQKTISDSKDLPPPVARPLNQQAEVLLNILKELDQIAATLETEITDRTYEKDRLAHVYALLERSKALIDTWDERKELLYNDVRKVFDSYPAAQPSSSWYVSGKALGNLTDLDRAALFAAKEFYKGNGPATVSTAAIDESLRDVLSKEYQNMKGIEKYGRSNGLCPYTPYEDLPASSRKLSEQLNPLPTGSGTGYQHPYYKILYHYNDVVRDYNKFCELSKDVLLLPAVHQPELFVLTYPKNDPRATVPVSVKQGNATVPVTPEQGGSPRVAGGAERPSTKPPQEHSVSADTKPVATSTSTQPPVTAPATRPETRVQRDTIYIERRDTVYLTGPGENLRSMEGYAINHMILLLDVSGSMNAPEKLPLLKASVLELVSMMRPEDKVSIIAFSEKPKALLTAASFKDDTRIRQAINALKSAGKTDANAGVKLAYKVADENYIRGGNNRIILATDGEFVLGEASRALVQQFSNEDIFLSIFNFGKGAGASKALERVAALGKGNYQYISKENVELQLIREAKAKKAK